LRYLPKPCGAGRGVKLLSPESAADFRSLFATLLRFGLLID
jgi:hypothetical protein